jgi:uncharacterized Zn finger protein (UPF0148 family)
MRCRHCGGAIFRDEDGVLACWNCGRRRYPKMDPRRNPSGQSDDATIKEDRLLVLIQPGVRDSSRG